MSYTHLRATGPAPSGEHQEHVRETIRTILLFLSALVFVAIVMAPAGGETAAPARTDSLPTFYAGA